MNRLQTMKNNKKPENIENPKMVEKSQNCNQKSNVELKLRFNFTEVKKD